MAGKTGKNKGSTGSLAKNRKAYHNYELVEKVEAGIVLLGSEVKSLRDGSCDLDGSYARIRGDECWLVGCKIAQYAQAGMNNHETLRDRKLLLHRRQLAKIKTKLEQRGFTLVPLRVYFNNRGLAKVELSLARGKKQYDKRAKKQAEQQRRDVDRSMKDLKR